jgi:hypothetical protein
MDTDQPLWAFDKRKKTERKNINWHFVVEMNKRVYSANFAKIQPPHLPIQPHVNVMRKEISAIIHKKCFSVYQKSTVFNSMRERAPVSSSYFLF